MPQRGYLFVKISAYKLAAGVAAFFGDIVKVLTPEMATCLLEFIFVADKIPSQQLLFSWRGQGQLATPKHGATSLPSSSLYNSTKR